jgi:hypothetical protein
MMPPLENDQNVTETFVDGPVGVNYVGGNLHITFYTVRVDHSVLVERPDRAATTANQVRRVTLRLVIPIPGAVDLRQTIDNMLQILRQQGMVQSTPMVSGPMTRQ